MVTKKKDNDKDTEPKKFLGPGASGDVDHPEVGAPGIRFAGPDAPVAVEETEKPVKSSAKDEK